MNDNFFSLGGDSVLAIRLVATARARGLDMSIQTIFKYPTLSDMALVATQLHEQEENEVSLFELLDGHQITSQILCEASKQCSVSEHLIEDIYPCSAMQSGLLALSAKDPGVYIMQLVYALPASLDVDKFMSAWDVVTLHNAALRTRFFEGESGLLQVVVKEPPQWQVVENKSLDSLLSAEKNRRMCLGERMSWYTLLHRSEPPEYHLIWTIHHSLLDGWSATQIASLVEQEYFGHFSPPVPTLAFNRFIRHLSKQDAGRARAFWRDQLIDAPAPAFPRLPSPTYRPRASAVLEYRVPSLKKDGITTATVVQAAWSLLMGIYSNSSDIVTGMTLNGRTAQLPGIDSIIGPTITTVPFRTRYDADELAIDLLQKIQSQYLKIIPFEQFGLQNIRRLSSDADAACKFRNLLVIQSADGESPRLLLGRKHTFSSLDCALLMECELYEQNINLRATFDDKLLHSAQIGRIFQQLEHIISELSSCDSSTKVSDLQQICSTDTQQILQWNTTSNAPKQSQTLVHALFKQRQQSQPNAPAVSAWDGELSYKTLDEYSSRLASYLQTHYGVGPESLVTICFEKSLWVVVAMLAVLKAGGACVPTDPKTPTGRLQTIVQSLGESNASLILTSAVYADRLGTIGPRVLIISPTTLDSLPTDVRLRSTTATPANSAFIVFTSGSTGNPKGIVLEHSALCSSVLTHGSFIKLGTHSRVLQFAAYTFDISIGDIFATLIHGGCVCIPSEHDKMNNLSGAIQSFKANHVSLTATVASYLQPEDVPSLKVLVVAGEPMTRMVIEHWANHVTLINMYGPAECTVYCIGKGGINREEDCSNIGKGVGAMVWIADPQDYNSLTPIGGVGELLIEGPNLARGYLGNEAQTKSAFIENPVWAKSHGLSSVRRFYRTGDLGFYNHDGSIGFIGRNDGQIKIRGQRLEIGEVEYRLRECLPDAIEAAVSVVTPNLGERLLAAFLVVKNGADETTDRIVARAPADLKHFQALMDGVENRLQSILPSYMVPSVYVPIYKLPLSASGKIDRKRLQCLTSELTLEELSSFRGTEITKSKPPSSRMEKRIQSLWEAILNTAQIGVDDNFFRLGGDSLTAMRLVSIARKEGISMTVDQVFKNPILSNMAITSHDESSIETLNVPRFSMIGNLDREQLCSEAVSQCSIRREQIEDIYPCIALQTVWMGVYEQAQVVFSLPRSLDLRKFRAALRSLISSHVVLRSRIIRTNSMLFQVVVNEPAKLCTAKSLDEYLKKDRENIIDCGHRLQRYCFIQTKNTNERYFVWSAQHSSYDAWSLGLFFKELEATYLRGPSREPPVRMNRLIKYIGEVDKIAAGNFFRSHLAGAITKPLFTVPDGYGRYNNTLAKTTIHLPNYQGTDITIAMMIELAWAIVIGRAVGSNDVVLGLILSGRNAPVSGIEDLMGPTATRIPLRINIDTHQKIQGLLQFLKELQIAVMPFEHLGWNMIREMVPEIEPLLKDTIGINILPFLDSTTLGSGIGLKMVKSFLRFECPFYIFCEPTENILSLRIMSDKAIISEERVESLMRRFEHTLLQVIGSHTDPDQKIGDIDSSEVPDSDWTCTRTPWDCEQAQS